MWRKIVECLYLSTTNELDNQKEKYPLKEDSELNDLMSGFCSHVGMTGNLDA